MTFEYKGLAQHLQHRLAAVNSLNASWLTRFLARLLGRKRVNVEVTNGGKTFLEIHLSEYRGKLYFIDFVELSKGIDASSQV